MATRDRVPSAAIFWMKVRGGPGWREQQDLNVGGNGQPVVYEFCWRGDTEAAAAPALKPEPPTIDAEPEAGDTHTGTELTVSWAGESD
jgi:hypothetical protein